MGRDLFRKEAIDARANRFSSPSSIATPASFLAYAIFIISLAVSIVLFVYFGKYSPKDTVSGYLTTTVGGVEVYSQSDGDVFELHIAEGDLVTEGQELMSIGTSRATGQSVATRKRILSARRSELSDLLQQIERETDEFSLRIKAAEDNISSLHHRLTMLSKQRELLSEGLQLSERKLARLTQLDTVTYVTQQDRDKARAAIVEFKLRVHELELSIDSIRTEIRRKQQMLVEIPVRRDARSAEMRSTSHQLSINIAEELGRDSQRVLAPYGGVVSGLLVREGQTIRSNTPLLNVVPESSEFYAELLIPTRTIAFVRAGAVVRIRYDAFPHQKFGTFEGVVESIARTTVLPTDKRFRVAITEPVYIANVRILSQTVLSLGESQGLQSGMTLTADILRDERRLIEWVFDPLIRATKKL